VLPDTLEIQTKKEKQQMRTKVYEGKNVSADAPVDNKAIS